MRIPKLFTPTLLVLLLTFSMCSVDYGTLIEYYNNGAEETGTIGPDGGSVEVLDEFSPVYGAKIEIPAGALGEEVKIEIGEAPDYIKLDAFPDNSLTKFAPIETTFIKDVTITLQGPQKTGKSGSGWFAAKFDGSPSDYIRIEIDHQDINSNTFSFIVNSLGYYVIVEDPNSDPFVLIDPRDNIEYEVVKIGEQYWMAENLAYLPVISPSDSASSYNPYYYVYDYQGFDVNEAKGREYYKTYGVLYNWEAAMIACPPGWHLPSDQEVITMENELGMSLVEAESEGHRTSGQIGYKLKNTQGWYDNGNGNNSSGFTLLPSGVKRNDGAFAVVGERGYFWTATATSEFEAYGRRVFYNDDGIMRYPNEKHIGIPVRCIRNE